MMRVRTLEEERQGEVALQQTRGTREESEAEAEAEAAPKGKDRQTELRRESEISKTQNALNFFWFFL